MILSSSQHLSGSVKMLVGHAALVIMVSGLEMQNWESWAQLAFKR